MSAFLFVMPNKAIKEATIEKLHEILLHCKTVVDNFDWSKYQQCSFDSDQASGFKANIFKIEEELQFRAADKGDEKLSRVIVPGYNPKEES